MVIIYVYVHLANQSLLLLAITSLVCSLHSTVIASNIVLYTTFHYLVYPCECQNGACEDLVNASRCLCYPGWTGRLCETDIDYCSFDTSPSGLCDNIGTIRCIDGNYTYICTCVSGNNSSQDVNEFRFYLDQQSNSCVRQCPLFFFGNHTGGLCQPCKLHNYKER